MADLSKFFKDSNGKVVVGQSPNLPIILWFGLMLLSFVTSGHIADVSSALSRLLLFVWAYLELSSGDSLFRKLLGFIVLIYIIVRIIL